MQSTLHKLFNPDTPGRRIGEHIGLAIAGRKFIDAIPVERPQTDTEETKHARDKE